MRGETTCCGSDSYPRHNWRLSANRLFSMLIDEKGLFWYVCKFARNCIYLSAPLCHPSVSLVHYLLPPMDNKQYSKNCLSHSLVGSRPRPAGPTSSQTNGPGRTPPTIGVASGASPHVEGRHLRGGDLGGYIGDPQRHDANFYSASEPGPSLSPTHVLDLAQNLHKIDPEDLEGSLETLLKEFQIFGIINDNDRMRIAYLMFPNSIVNIFMTNSAPKSFSNFMSFIKSYTYRLFPCHRQFRFSQAPQVSELEDVAVRAANCPKEELIKHFMLVNCPEKICKEVQKEVYLPMKDFRNKLRQALSYLNSSPQVEPADEAPVVPVIRPLPSSSPINRADAPETSQRAVKARRRRRRRGDSRGHAPSQPRPLMPPSSGQQRRASSPSSGSACHVQTNQGPQPLDVPRARHLNHSQQKKAKRQSPPLLMKRGKKQVLPPSDAAHSKQNNHHHHHQQKMAKRQPPPLPMKRGRKQEPQPPDAARAEHCHHRHNHHQQQHSQAIPKQQHLMADQWCRAAATTTPSTTLHITSAKEFVSNFYLALNSPLQFNSFFPFISPGQILPRSTSFREPGSLFRAPMALSPVRS